MGYIPEDAKWYLAEIVEKITVEGDPRNVVHTNLVLVRADSPEEACQKATELGTAGETSFENPDGRRVTFRFRGLRDLNVIYDDLEHGAELSFSETIDMNDSAIAEWVTPKERLGVFRPITRSAGPDYSSRDVLEKLSKEFPNLQPNDNNTSSE
jgi:hypothetical protein